MRSLRSYRLRFGRIVHAVLDSTILLVRACTTDDEEVSEGDFASLGTTERNGVGYCGHSWKGTDESDAEYNLDAGKVARHSFGVGYEHAVALGAGFLGHCCAKVLRCMTP